MSRSRNLSKLLGADGAFNSSDISTILGYTPQSPTDVSNAVANLVNSAPAALNTLSELATALGNDANFATTVTNALAGKLNKSGDSLTGSLNLSGKGFRDTSGSGKVYNNVTPVYDLYNNGSTAGAIIVNTNIPYNAGNMCSIKIAGYSYNTGQAWEMDIGGYFGEGNFYSLRSISSGHPFKRIRAARNITTDKVAIILGDTSDIYGTSIFVDRFIQNFSSQTASYADDWSCARITSLSNHGMVTDIPDSVPGLEVIDVLNINPAGNGLDYIAHNNDGGGTSLQVVGSRVLDIYSTSGGHGGSWGYPVRIDTAGIYRLKLQARLSSTNGAIHGGTPSSNYKYTISTFFGISGASVGGKWDVDTLGNGTKVAAISGLTWLSQGNYQMSFSTNGYDGIKQIYIYGLWLERVG